MTSPSTAPAEPRRLPPVALAGILLSVALLVWTLHDVRPADLARHVGAARLLPLIGAVALATLTFPIRTWRWRVILQDVGHRNLGLVPLWHATAIGFMANNLLPARGGEVARCYAARRLVGVRFSTALASVGVERVFDGLILVGFMALAMAAPSFPAGALVGGIRVRSVAAWTGALFGAALLISLVLVHRPARAMGWIRAIAGRLLPERAATRATSVAEGVLGGLAVLKNPGQFALVVLWSVVHWLVSAASFALAYAAFDIHLPLESALLLQGLIAVGVAIPSSPGFFGLFEAATRATLGLYGVAADHAVSYAVAYHISTFIPITLLGLYSLTRAHLHLADLRAGEATDGAPA